MMKPNRLFVLLLMILPASVQMVRAQATSPADHKPAALPADLQSRVDDYMQAYIKAGEFNGVIMIAKDGKPVVLKAYGYADYNKKILNTPNKKFCLASVTKQFTATAILMLQERGKLHVEDRLSTYLPDCPPGWRDVTLKHLLTHTSGISTDVMNIWDDYYFKKALPAQALPRTLQQVKDNKLVSAPGAEYKYNNFGYVLLSAVVEKAAGRPWADFLKTEIFAPLGMTDTGVCDDSPVSNAAYGHDRENGKPEAIESFGADTPGASGIYSTASDLLKWDQALYTDRLLPAAARQAMFTPYEGKDGYGYGWAIDTVKGRRRLLHTGSIGITLAEIDRFPDDGLCVVVLCNYGFAQEDAVAEDLATLAFGEKTPPPLFVKLSKETLNRYVGFYRSGTLRLTVLREGDQLAIQGKSGIVALKTLSKTTFGIEDTHRFEFVVDAHGSVQAMHMREYTHTYDVAKVPIPAVNYARYVGTYRCDGGMGVVRIFRDHDRLMLEVEDKSQPRYEMLPLSAVEFTVPDALDGAEIRAVFTVGKQDKKVYVVWSAAGAAMHGVKIR